MRWATLKSWMKPRRGRMLETISSNKPSEGLTLLPHSVLLLLLHQVCGLHVAAFYNAAKVAQCIGFAACYHKCMLAGHSS